MDVFAIYWQRLTQVVGWDDAGISGGKISNCSDITYFTYWQSGLETRDLFINDVDIFIIIRVEEFSLVISVENALYLKNGLW